MTDHYSTSHLIRIGDSGTMPEIEDQAIDLVVTSPPYPMIKMWDEQFSDANPVIGEALEQNNGALAFEAMHRLLDPVWRETYRILKPGGIACINIGDATRTLDGHFQLFPNHARIVTFCRSEGFTQLPVILWRKPTNAPTKFMGSGMLPPGAYVTLEHEYILIFRKGRKREFDRIQKEIRHRSAYFWEERNAWFSDVWFDLRGTSQKSLHKSKNRRSGAFPLELPYRLINMFSLQGDTVVDPFLGSGTSMIAAMCAGRNSIGYEIDGELQPGILEKLPEVPNIGNRLSNDRLKAHRTFVQEHRKTRGELKHVNRIYGFPVVTRQEEALQLLSVQNVRYNSSTKFTIEYSDHIQSMVLPEVSISEPQDTKLISGRPPKGHQMKLF